MFLNNLYEVSIPDIVNINFRIIRLNGFDNIHYGFTKIFSCHLTVTAAHIVINEFRYVNLG